MLCKTLYSFLFVDRYDFVNERYVLREEDSIESEVKFVIGCLIKLDLIEKGEKLQLPLAANQRFTITARVYARIDEIKSWKRMVLSEQNSLQMKIDVL